NVESASAAGDSYDLRKVLLADGSGAVIGSLLGSPFPPAVYIGHPGWKAVGGRVGYSLATGIVIALVCLLGLTALLLAVIPLCSPRFFCASLSARSCFIWVWCAAQRLYGPPPPVMRRLWCSLSFRTSPSGRRRKSMARSAQPAPP